MSVGFMSSFQCVMGKPPINILSLSSRETARDNTKIHNLLAEVLEVVAVL